MGDTSPAGPPTCRPPHGRAERLAAAVRRDGPTCVWCGRGFGALVSPTTEHLVPRVKGGPSWAENEVAACARCNHERGHVSPAEWMDECRRRGWAVDDGRVLRTLTALQAAIGVRGGHRRARPYVVAQLRRIRRQLG